MISDLELVRIPAFELEKVVKRRLAHEIADVLVNDVEITETFIPTPMGAEKQITARVTIMNDQEVKKYRQACQLLKEVNL